MRMRGIDPASRWVSPGLVGVMVVDAGYETK